MAKHRNFLRETFLDFEDTFHQEKPVRAKRAKGSGRREQVAFRMEPALRCAIEMMAKTYGITMGHAVHRLLEAAVSQWAYDFNSGRIGGTIEGYTPTLDHWRGIQEELGPIAPHFENWDELAESPIDDPDLFEGDV